MIPIPNAHSGLRGKWVAEARIKISQFKQPKAINPTLNRHTFLP